MNSLRSKRALSAKRGPGIFIPEPLFRLRLAQASLMLFFVKMIPLSSFKENEELPRQGSLRFLTAFPRALRAKRTLGDFILQTPRLRDFIPQTPFFASRLLFHLFF